MQAARQMIMLSTASIMRIYSMFLDEFRLRAGYLLCGISIVFELSSQVTSSHLFANSTVSAGAWRAV